MKKTRFLKVYKKAQQRERRYLMVPEIRLEGQWLEKAGFCNGTRIQVSISRHKLVVEVVHEKIPSVI